MRRKELFYYVTRGSNVTRHVHWCVTVDYQQIENNNKANVIFVTLPCTFCSESVVSDVDALHKKILAIQYDMIYMAAWKLKHMASWK